MTWKQQKSKIKYTTVVDKNSGTTHTNRLLVGTPTTGTVRIEWVAARYGQIIPTNWSMIQMNQFMNGFCPLNYAVADAQNLIVKAALESNVEWMMLIESDNVLPPDAFVKFNEYMRKGDTPVVSGLYFTKSEPAEPMTYRGRGTSYYTDWKMGDKVWCDGVPTGALLVHTSILREMWKDAPEYLAGTTPTRRVFVTPNTVWTDPENTNFFAATTGTSDLDWCTRVIEGNYLEKAGWLKHQKMEYPFLVDTNIAVKHIDPDGQTYPTWMK